MWVAGEHWRSSKSRHRHGGGEATGTQRSEQYTLSEINGYVDGEVNPDLLRDHVRPGL
jgi:hypothetical protein